MPCSASDLDGRTSSDPSLQDVLDLRDVTKELYAHVCQASGLGRQGVHVAQEIECAVKRAAGLLENTSSSPVLAKTLGLQADKAQEVCTVAALLLFNACLLHRRLCSVPGLETLRVLNGFGAEKHPRSVLLTAWQQILERDYAPVFEPAVAVLEALEDRGVVHAALFTLTEAANSTADRVSELGYDHAGPLYHRILSRAQGDGAYYTNNTSALMLARLALPEDFTDWSDPAAVRQLRVMDPACGTGTLLMAALQTIKERTFQSRGLDSLDSAACAALHKLLVEEVICGLDINRHAVQLAACNMTLGSPTVDYRRMNLYTMRHGPQPDGSVKAGSLEILGLPKRSEHRQQEDLPALIAHLSSSQRLGSRQVDDAGHEFPTAGLDLVIMNPPFTNNVKRMQQHELALRDRVVAQDPQAGNLIHANGIGTFFTALVDRLVDQSRGTLAQVTPLTALTNTAGQNERRFLAERFHVEQVVTSHDMKHLEFAGNSGINNCLLICRRAQNPDY